MIGELIAGRYRITALLGKGAAGAVYRADDDRLRRAVAVKVLHEDAPPVAIARFRREGEAAARLSSPHIAKVLDVVEGPALILELCEGETLAARLGGREKSLSIRTALSIATQIAKALALAHDMGIVHRDITPANIMLVRAPNQSDHQQARDFVKVLDFGFAKKVASKKGSASDTAHLNLTATTDAVSEQAGPEIDVAALGKILSVMMAPHKKRIPKSVTSIIDRALHPSPSDRFRDGFEILVALEEALKEEPSRSSSAHRRPFWIGLLIALATGVVVLVVVLILHRPPIASSAPSSTPIRTASSAASPPQLSSKLEETTPPTTANEASGSAKTRVTPPAHGRHDPGSSGWLVVSNGSGTPTVAVRVLEEAPDASGALPRASTFPLHRTTFWQNIPRK